MIFLSVLIGGGLMAVLGAVLAGMLAAANKKLRVEEDPRIEQVESMLPQANCGGCGLPGCRAFAEAVIGGQVVPGHCNVCAKEVVVAIANVLGVEAGTREKRVARCACAGGTNVAKVHTVYHGLQTCRAAALVSGGGKACPWGCLGYGDCSVSCRFDAIHMNEYGIPEVDENKCTACGECVIACPKQLFSIHPESHRLWVSCRNRAVSKEALSQCAVACIGCGRCAKDAAPSLISIKDNLAEIDYEMNSLASQQAIERCPTGAIVWMDKDCGPVKGAAANKAQRQKSQPAGKEV